MYISLFLVSISFALGPVFQWNMGLSLDRQIECMFKKAYKKLRILSRIRIFIMDKTACKIYKTMVRPHLEYVDFIIESGSKVYVSKLHRLQERALRKIEHCSQPKNRKTCSMLEMKYGIENLHKRRKHSLLMQMYGQSKKETNLVNNRCDRILRSDNKSNMKYNFSSLTKLHNSPYYRGVKLWNNLLAIVQKCKVRGEFNLCVNK